MTPAHNAQRARRSLPIALGAILLLLGGCGGLSVEPKCSTSAIIVNVQPTIRVGQTVQAAADYSMSDCPASTVVVWSTDNSAVLAITSDGKVTGVSAGGPITVRAKVNDKTGTSGVTVTP